MNTPRKPLNRSVDRAEVVRPYYIDLGQKDVRTGMYARFVFEAGIPKYPYASGLHYNVVFVCHFALHLLHRWLLFGRAEDRDYFVDVSHWLLEHGEQTERGFIFPHRYEWGEMGPPWISALGQGRLLSVFTRAWQVTSERKFVETARQALHPFQLSVDQDGLQAVFPEGGLTFEEYPQDPPRHVLNGLITALFGLYDLATIDASQEAESLFEEATAALAANLHRYDLGYWSAYDLAGRVPTVAGDGYHDYHIQQLWVLHEMTGREIFGQYARRWDGYHRGPRLHLMRNLSRVYRRLTH